MRSAATTARGRARPLGRRLERALDGCAAGLGRALGRAGRAVADATVRGARAVRSEPSRFSTAAGALAIAPALAEIAAGPVAGKAAGLARDAGVLVVAARAVRATVVAEAGPASAWTPVFRAAMRRAHAEGRCSALSLATSVGVTRWMDAGFRDAAWFAKDASADALEALVERAPRFVAAEVAGSFVGLVPYASGVRAVARAATDARAAVALVELVRDEARANLRRRPAEVVELADRRTRVAATTDDAFTLASKTG